MAQYKIRLSTSVSDLEDKLGWMMIKAPKFEDTTGYLPGRNLDITFFELKESLKLLRKTLGEDRYFALATLSDRMRAHFEADPEDKTDDGLKGRELIREMQNLIRQPRRSKTGG
jgi:hypothetical protein